MKLNKYFSRSEFQCSCGCGMAGVDAELLTALTRIREHFNAPVTITSGNRCAPHNKSIGGAEKSYHVRGMAADFKVEGIEPKAVADYVEANYPTRFGVGRYSSWTHLDVRDEKARWKH